MPDERLRAVMLRVFALPGPRVELPRPDFDYLWASVGMARQDSVGMMTPKGHVVVREVES